MKVVESILPFAECHRGLRDTMGHIYWLGECHVRIDYTFTLTIKFIQQQIIKQSLNCAKIVNGQRFRNFCFLRSSALERI